MNEIQNILKQEGILPTNAHLLVAVSAGPDSMALLHFLHKHKYTVTVAHANFTLRGNESDAEEDRLKAYCRKKNIPLLVKRFHTKAYVKKYACSIQEAARNLRYAWFKELCNKHGFDAVLTAHHAQDNIETFFINLLRGAGAAGLSGMPVRNGKVLRPMLYVSKERVDAYVRQHKLPFCTDSSNLKDVYLRNKIRLQLLPLLKEMQPAYGKIIQEEMRYMGMLDAFMKKYTLAYFNIQEIQNTPKISISIKKLQASFEPELLLYYLLHPFGFHSDVIAQIVRALNASPGKMFYSETHQLCKDRQVLILEKRNVKRKTPEEFFISEHTRQVKTPLRLKVKIGKRGVKLSKDKRQAFLATDKLQFPLLLRKWKAGDSFVPFGMKGRKKVSDYLSDVKMPQSEKENTYVLLSGKTIVWLVGQRIAQGYGIHEKSKSVLQIQMEE